MWQLFVIIIVNNNEKKPHIIPQGFFLLSFRTVNKEDYRLKITLRNKCLAYTWAYVNLLESKVRKMGKEKIREQGRGVNRKSLFGTRWVSAAYEKLNKSVMYRVAYTNLESENFAEEI